MTWMQFWCGLPNKNSVVLWMADKCSNFCIAHKVQCYSDAREQPWLKEFKNTVIKYMHIDHLLKCTRMKKTHQTPNRYLQSLCVFQWIRKIAHAQLHQRIINPRPNITSTYNSHSYTGITLVFIFLVLCVPMLRFAWIDLFLDLHCILFYFEWMKSQANFRKKWFLTN